MEKIITVKIWRSWRIVAEPTATTPMIKKDDFGVRWVWLHGGKRVTVKKVK